MRRRVTRTLLTRVADAVRQRQRVADPRERTTRYPEPRASRGLGEGADTGFDWEPDEGRAKLHIISIARTFEIFVRAAMIPDGAT